MTKKIKAAIVGYGNIGQYTLQALHEAPDFEVAGVVRRSAKGEQPAELLDLPIVEQIDELEGVDVAILACPSRLVEETALPILERGIATVDSFDIHTGIVPLRRSLAQKALAHKAVAILSAGWDPGSDSVVRTLFQAMLPKGLTYTDFGPGMSMGHTVAVKAVPGVEEALSMTIPMGTGIHRRQVYVKIAPDAHEEAVKNAILTDDYFRHDETYVYFVDNVKDLQDVGHGVNLSRKGVSGASHNQRLSFHMSINNPALTAQILVASARAAMRMQPGAYTLMEIPPVDLLPGDREDWIKHLC